MLIKGNLDSQQEAHNEEESLLQSYLEALNSESTRLSYCEATGQNVDLPTLDNVSNTMLPVRDATSTATQQKRSTCVGESDHQLPFPKQLQRRGALLSSKKTVALKTEKLRARAHAISVHL